MEPITVPYLRAHSYFGFLDSLLSPKALVETAQNKHINTLGLTDHRYLTGALEFYLACISAGIKPILGLEIDFNYHGHTGYLTLLAKDLKGWSNLSHLSSMILMNQTIPNYELLSEKHEGLITIIGGEKGILKQLILNSPSNQYLPDRLIDEFKHRFHQDLFIEIQRYDSGPTKIESALLQLASKHHLPILATQNIHYKNKKDQGIYHILQAIKQNLTLGNKKLKQNTTGSAYFAKPEDFKYRYQDLPEAISNLQMVVDRCNLELPIGRTQYPQFPTPNGVSQSDFLRLKAYAGAKKIYNTITPVISGRLEYELKIITEMGYEPIFLIVEDIINHARNLGIPTSSRGSAASSLVAHCLDITSPDPMALNLYFERFLNPARQKPPDIDTDIASHRRDEVIQYVFETYGADRVAMVSTINRYRPKSAFGDVAKAYGLSAETIRQLSKKLPSSFRYHHNNDEDPFSSLLPENSLPQLKNILDDARVILDHPRHLSVHPGGIIIAPFPMMDLIPLVYSTSLEINHSQFDLEGIEKLGLVKIDLLGIRGLTVIGEVADQIQSWRSSEFDKGLTVLNTIPEKEDKTSQTVSEAKTIGCFQIESPGMRATLREIGAKNVEDIMAALALYRPGPLRGGLRDAFVRRFRGEEPVSHIHESLKTLLDNTLGVILYQEQVLQIAHELGGLSIAQADILRRAMSHFNPGGMMENLQQNFIAGAVRRHNLPKAKAEQIWEMMAAFAGYGFPKAHAASYAKLAWNSAWCKTHFPAEFMAAVLGYGGGYYSQRVYLMEARRLGLSIKPPHINHSKGRFSVKYPKGKPVLYMGLNQVRDLTQKTIEAILHQRPFSSLESFLMVVNPQTNEAQNLIKCGALEGMISIQQGLQRINQHHMPGQMALFTTSTISEDWPEESQYQAQIDILGVSLSPSPYEHFTDQIQSSGAVRNLEALGLVDERVTIAGMRQALRRQKSKSNRVFGILYLEDLTGVIQVLLPPKLYSDNLGSLQNSGPFIVEGIIEKDQNSHRIRLVADKIVNLSIN